MTLDPATKAHEVSLFDHLELLSEMGLSHPNTGKLLFLNTYRLENDASGPSIAAAVNSLNTALSIIYSMYLTAISKL